MYRAPSKRQQLIKRAVVYGIMTSTVLLLVALLVFVMLGYRFNRDTSTIEQGGLVQFNSRPGDASVTVGSAKIASSTPSKITINPGSYTVTMQKNGYHTWSKLSDVQAGQVLWLNYAQLVPKKINTETIATYDNVDDALASPNGERYAMLQSAASPEITLADITRNPPKQATITLPPDALPAASGNTYSLKTWASDSDRLLMTVKNNETTQWILVDRRDADETINLSARYSATIAEAIFDPRSSERIIIRTTSGELRIINTANNTLSGVLASSVSYMSTYMNDALLLVQKTSPTTQQVGYVSYGSDTVRQIQEVDSTQPVKVTGATYFSDPYIAILVGKQLDVLQVRSLPSSDSEQALSMTNVHTATLPANPTYLNMRTGGRFVLAQYPSGVLTYDVELKKHSQTSFTKPVSKEIRWIDRYHFYLTNGSSLEVMEFDGGNPHTITSLTTGFDAIQSNEGKYVYTINSTKNGSFVLQRSQMILDN